MYYAIHTTELFENNFSLRIYNIDYQYIAYNTKYKINIWEGYKKGYDTAKFNISNAKKARNPLPGGKSEGKRRTPQWRGNLSFGNILRMRTK